ncbi:unnamed protein product [Hyaloperonospora brassicae]|uniref:PIH1 domain-containing protein 1 n=1 Tax=Hyaloperonospora brassicae TaxID=162125 RepID=A0AAV0TYU8_HYABA|nr:unnamed protein product [Hyaloperonospora brassicae]
MATNSRTTDFQSLSSSSGTSTTPTTIATPVTAPKYSYEDEVHATSTTAKDSRLEQLFLAGTTEIDLRSILNGYIQDSSRQSDREIDAVDPIDTVNQEKGPTNAYSVTPAVGFVLKTKWDVQHKVFINICTSSRLRPLSRDDTIRSTSQHSACSWQFSFCVGPKRLEKDQRGAGVPTVDVCVHPQVATIAVDRLDPRGPLVISKCFEAVEIVLQHSGCNAAAMLDRNCHVLRGVQYKSGRPNPMSLTDEREVSISRPLERVRDVRTSTAAKAIVDRDNEDTKSSRLIEAASDCADDVVQNELMCEGRVDGSTLFEEEEVQVKSDVKDPCDKVQQKKKMEHRFTYSGHYEALHHAQADSGSQVSVDLYRPKELVVTVSLPATNSAEGLNLHVSERMLRLSADSSVPSDYEPLELALPFPVIESNGSARFDRKRHEVVVTLPVQPPEEPKPHFVSLVIQDDDDEKQAEAASRERKLSHDETKSSDALASEQKMEGGQKVRILHEWALVTANDPQTIAYEQQTIQTQSPVPVTSLSSAAKNKSATRTHENVASTPPLENCCHKDVVRATNTSAASSTSSHNVSTMPVEATLRPVDPIEPPCEAHVTSQCLSYIVGVAGIESSSVTLAFPSTTSLRLHFLDSSQEEYELHVAVFPVDIDSSTAEFDVASENMAVILYRKNATAALLP